MYHDLFFDVEHVGNGMLRVENEYFPVADDEFLIHPDGSVTASIALENGTDLVLLIAHQHARVYLWDEAWCMIVGGRIVRAPDNHPDDDWNEMIRSTDDLKALMRQIGVMEASQHRPGEAQVSSAPGQLGDIHPDSTLAELLA